MATGQGVTFHFIIENIFQRQTSIYSYSSFIFIEHILIASAKIENKARPHYDNARELYRLMPSHLRAAIRLPPRFISSPTSGLAFDTLNDIDFSSTIDISVRIGK